METEITFIARETIFILIKVSAPILLIALVVGVAISLVQALTQIQENTLTFVPKILVMMLSLLFLTPYMFENLKHLTEMVFLKIAGIG